MLNPPQFISMDVRMRSITREGRKEITYQKKEKSAMPPNANRENI